MILKCDCVNGNADALHGKGLRPHSALVRLAARPREYCCDYCSYVRTKATGLRTGAKSAT